MRSTLNARSSSSTSPANAAASADFSTSSSPCSRYSGSGVPAAICWRTAAGVSEATRLERLEDGADDGAGELGADPLERGGVLLEEGGWIGRGGGGCGAGA